MALPLVPIFLRFADRLRFRQLFLITSTLFLIDLVIPDVIPFIDELLLGLLTLLLASIRKPKIEPKGTDKASGVQQ